MITYLLSCHSIFYMRINRTIQLICIYLSSIILTIYVVDEILWSHLFELLINCSIVNLYKQKLNFFCLYYEKIQWRILETDGISGYDPLHLWSFVRPLSANAVNAIDLHFVFITFLLENFIRFIRWSN